MKIDLTKSSKNRECMICHYCLFNHGFKFQDHVCNEWHDLIMLRLNISVIAIIIVKDVNESETIHLLENSVLGDREYL